MNCLIHFYDYIALIDICLTCVPLLLNTHYLFGACYRCDDFSKRIPVELHLIPNYQRCPIRSQTIRAFSRQLWNERISITANDFLVINYRLLAAVLILSVISDTEI